MRNADPLFQWTYFLRNSHRVTYISRSAIVEYGENNDVHVKIVWQWAGLGEEA